MSEILVGTSGYSYNEWVGCVYPEGTKQKDFLSCYSAMFPTVELNFSYYTMPKAENLSKMLVEGGESLTFAMVAATIMWLSILEFFLYMLVNYLSL